MSRRQWLGKKNLENLMYIPISGKMYEKKSHT